MNEAGVAPSLMTYNTLIAGCVRAQAPSEALSVFYLMKERGIKRDQVTVFFFFFWFWSDGEERLEFSGARVMSFPDELRWAKR